MAFISLPVVTVQPDFHQVIRDVDDGLVPVDKFWVSCYKAGETSVHAKVEVELDDIDRNLLRFTPREGDVEFARIDNGHSVTCRPLNIPPTPVLLPRQAYSDPERSTPLRPQRITAFDVAPDSTRFATGHLDGSITVSPSTPLSIRTPSTATTTATVPTTTTTITAGNNNINTNKRKLVSKPHLSCVNALQFFPSSRVLLSCGADFSLSILSAEFPETWPVSSSPPRIQPVRVLRAHTRSVTSACIIGLGRNIVSTSMDATLKLWDVSSGGVIHTLNASAAVLCSTIGTRMPTPPDGEDIPSSSSSTSGQDDDDLLETPEVGNTVVYAGLQNGSFEVVDLRTKTLVYTSPPPSGPPAAAPLNAISYLPTHYLLATGASDGIVTLYDVRSLSSPLTSFRRNEANISDLDFVPPLPPRSGAVDAVGGAEGDVNLAVATRDGLPFVASIIPEGPGVFAELIGADCDPVESVRVRGGGGGSGGDKVEVWSASDDAVVRRYVL